VSSEELGQELATCRVPLFVLNACQSAREGRDPYSSVASQLVASGAEGVVAMSYSVYSTAAAKFMNQFYEALVNQKLLSEAVAAGRRTLHADPYRDSVVGPLKLQNWMIPVLYQKEYGYTPIETVEDIVFPMIPHKNIKIKDFVDKFENPNKVVDTLCILEKKGEITAYKGYMRQV